MKEALRTLVGDELILGQTEPFPADGVTGELGVALDVGEWYLHLLRPAGLVEDVHQAIPEGDRARSRAARRQQRVDAVDFGDVGRLGVYFGVVLSNSDDPS